MQLCIPNRKGVYAKRPPNRTYLVQGVSLSRLHTPKNSLTNIWFLLKSTTLGSLTCVKFPDISRFSRQNLVGGHCVSLTVAHHLHHLRNTFSGHPHICCHKPFSTEELFLPVAIKSAHLSPCVSVRFGSFYADILHYINSLSNLDIYLLNNAYYLWLAISRRQCKKRQKM